jgi:hypothetical protein
VIVRIQGWMCEACNSFHVEGAAGWDLADATW